MRGKKLLSLLLSAALVGTMLPTAALAAEDSGADSNPLVCTTDEGCAAEIHEENCPLYETPKEENEEPPVLETIPAETVPHEENALASTPADADGDETVPGWVDENDGHSKQIAETFDFVVDNIAYSIVEGGVEVSRWYWKWAHSCSDQHHTITVHAGSLYTGKEIKIPATVTYDSTEYAVVGIGESAFFNASNYTVSMPEDSSAFTYIGDQVFFQTSPNMESITIPASVTHIGRKSFALNEDSIPVIIPEDSKLQVIGDQAFANNSAITELNLPDTLTTIGSQAFSRCTSLTSITIPASVTDIQTDTFDGYYNADNDEENVAFAEGSIFKLQDGVLYDTENLIRVLDWRENVAVPDGIKYIGANAFNASGSSNTNVLKNITFPESLVSIGDWAFRACKSLTSITIPANVTEIGSGAFHECEGLTTVTILAPLTELTGSNSSISYGIFEDCIALNSVELPESVKVIGKYTFRGCSSLSSISLPGVEKIETLAFKGSGLTSLDGFENVKSIGNQVFQNCTKLESAVVPKGVSNLPKGTFVGCTTLKTVVLPASMREIGNGALQNTLTAENSSLVMLGVAPTVDEKAFGNGKPENLTVYYPAASKETYQTAGLIDEDDTNGYALDLTDASMILASTTKAADANTLTLKTVTVPEGMTLTAASDTENVATVAVSEGNLVVTGVAEGTADITATLKVGDYVVLKDTCTVTVTAEGEVLPSVEEPNVALDKSITDDGDKKAVEAVAKSVEADKTINEAAKSEADKLNANDSEKEKLIEAAGEQGLTAGNDKQITLYTQTFLDIQATNIAENDSSISKITLNITPKVQVVASTATNSADIDIKTSNDDKDWNAVVVKEAEALTINTQAAITVQLPASFAGQPVYVKHEASNGTYFYKATADAQGEITFTSTHGFSPFTFSLTNEAVAEVNGVGYDNFQAAVDAAEDGQTVTVFQNENLTATISGSSKTITVENKTGSEISVSINGETFQVANNATHEYNYTRPSSGDGSSGSTRYTVSVEDADHGTVKVSPTRASKGSTVTITVKPDEGYELDKLVVTDKNGDSVKLTDKGDGKYTFKMPSSKVTVEATFVEIGTEPEIPVFTDVSTSAYYYDAVMWAVENGVTEGTSATTFSPEMACTRAQMVTFLWRAAGSPKPTTTNNPFTDVQSGEYYYDAVLWAVENGVTEGTSATTFSPDAVCTRAQTVTFLWRQAGAPVVNYAISFTDVDANAYYAEAVRWAVSEGVTVGTSNTTFSPDMDCTRAQIVTFMYRAAQ